MPRAPRNNSLSPPLRSKQQGPQGHHAKRKLLAIYMFTKAITASRQDKLFQNEVSL